MKKIVFKASKSIVVILALFFAVGFSHAQSVDVSSWSWFNAVYRNVYSYQTINIISDFTAENNIGQPGTNGNFTIQGKDSRFVKILGNGRGGFANQNGYALNFLNIGFNGFGTAFDLYSGIVTFSEKIMFSGNITTAINVYGNAQMKFINSTVDFLSNGNRYRGGAIDANGNVNVIIENSQMFFSGNNANDGGGIAIYGAAMVQINNSSVGFVDHRGNGWGATLDLRGRSYLEVINSTINIVLGRTDYGRGGGGGAMFFESSSANFSGSQVSFISNYAASDGGALNLRGNSNITFDGGKIEFTSNSANTGGAIFLDENSIAIFKNMGDSWVEFNYNKSRNGNGVIHLNGSASIDFGDAKIKAIGNEAKSGGFLYLENKIVTFSKESIFSGNKAVDGFGGAFRFVNNSNVTFANDSFSFFSNMAAEYGGAISFSGNSIVNFTDAKAIFSGNGQLNTQRGGRGGAIYIAGVNSELNITNSTISFTGNNTISGGAAYLYGKMNIIMSSVSFIANKASDGGALNTWTGNIVFDNAQIDFINNTADGNGGAIYLYQSLSTMEIFNSKVTFLNNLASGDGGAIYNYAGKIIINADISDIVFSGNKEASNKLNDISLTNNSISTMSANNFNIKMYGGIKANDSSFYIITKNNNELYLSGINSFMNMKVFDIAPGSLIKVENATFTYKNSVSMMLDRSSVSFINSDVVFSGNRGSITNNGVYLKSYAGLIFDIGQTNEVKLYGGIEATNVNNVIIKKGLGEMKLGGVNNSSANFSVQAGTLTLNTVSPAYLGSLNIGQGATFSSQDGSGKIKNTLVNDLALNGVLNIGIAYDGTQWFADTIRAISSIYVNPISTLTVTIYGTQDNDVVNIEIPILISNSDFSFESIFSYDPSGIYAGIQTRYDGSLKILYVSFNTDGSADGEYIVSDWADFVTKYQDADTKKITLKNTLTAGGGDSDINTRTNKEAITIIGKGFALDANELKYGFVLNGNQITFSSIAFTKFRKNEDGTAIKATNGSVINLNDYILFSGNRKLDTTTNDIYINNSKLNINPDSSQIIMEGGIIADYRSEIMYGNDGDGFWYLSGKNSFNNMKDFAVNGRLFVENAVWQLTNNNNTNLHLEFSTMNFNNVRASFLSNKNNTDGTIDAQESVFMNFYASTIDFVNNEARSGAVFDIDGNSNIKFSASSISFINNKAHAEYEGANAGFGGAIRLKESIVTFEGTTVSFIGNRARGGAAIDNYYGGELLFINSSVTFVDNRVSEDGGAINAKYSIKTTFNSAANFFGNHADNKGGAIYIEGDEAILELNTDNGDIVFSGNTAGKNETLRPNDIYNEAILEITGTKNAVKIYSGISSVGTIYKRNSGELWTSADNSRFEGTFEMSGGVTSVTVSGKMFAGENFISNSLLHITSNELAYKLIIDDGGILKHQDARTVVAANSFVNISEDVRFSGSNASAEFSGQIVNSRGTYFKLSMNGVAGNTIKFTDASVLFAKSDYAGTTVFENSLIDLVDYDVLLNNIASTRTITFSQFSAINSGLRFGLYLYEDNEEFKLSTDVLNVTAPSSGGLNFNGVEIYSDDFELDDDITHTVRVIFGDSNVFFNQMDTYVLEKGLYSYSITLADDPQQLQISVKLLDILFEKNETEGERTFNATTQTYHITKSLTDTAKGNFIVQGDINYESSKNIISGIFRKGTSSGSFFNLIDETILTIDNVTIRDAQIDGNGSVLRISNPSASATIKDSNFINNVATSSGGAIFVDGAILRIKASKDMSFSGNTANGKPNDIWLDGNSRLEFDVDNARIINLKGGIGATGTDATIVKKGQGTVDFSNRVNFSGNLDIVEGKINNYFAADGGDAVLKSLKVGSNATFSMSNHSQEFVRDYIHVSGDIIFSGNLEIDVNMSGASSTTKDNADFIYATGKIEINNNFTQNAQNLIINIYADDSSEESIRDIWIMQADDGISIYNNSRGFSGVIPLIATNLNWKFELKEMGTQGWLIFTDKLDFKFAETHNEKEISDFLEKYEDALKDIIDPIKKAAQDGDIRSARGYLDQLSGAFIVDAISMGAIDNAAIKLYPRIVQPKGGKTDSFWMQSNIDEKSFAKDKGTDRLTKSQGLGGEIGAVFIETENSLTGIYLEYAQSKLTNTTDKADLSDISIGLYGGIFGNSVNMRWNIGGGLQSYKVKRDLSFLTKPAYPMSEFTAMNIKAGMEIELLFGLFKPFLAMTAGYVSSDKIEEKELNNSATNLTIDANAYARSTISGGFRISDTDGKFRWHMQEYAQYAAIGNNPKYKVSMKQIPDAQLDIWGSKQSDLLVGVGMGFEVLFSQWLSLYVNGDSKFGVIENQISMASYDANVGFSFKFGNMRIESQAKAIVKEKEQINFAVQQKYKPQEKTVQPPETKIVKKKVQEVRTDTRSQLPMKPIKLVAAKYKVGSYDISEEYLDNIREKAKLIKSYGYNTITVEGHSDASGDNDHNERLSVMRAMQVYVELFRSGLDLDKMEYEGHGSRVPRASNATPEGRAENRRSEINVK